MEKGQPLTFVASIYNTRGNSKKTKLVDYKDNELPSTDGIQAETTQG